MKNKHVVAVGRAHEALLEQAQSIKVQRQLVAEETAFLAELETRYEAARAEHAAAVTEMNAAAEKALPEAAPKVELEPMAPFLAHPTVPEYSTIQKQNSGPKNGKPPAKKHLNGHARG